MWPQDLDYDFKPPTISTYNAYANNLFRDFALAIGYEPEAALLTEAAAFQLAREVVLKQGSSVDERLQDLDQGLNAIVENVLALAQSMNDNLVEADMIEDLIAGVTLAVSELPKKAGSTDKAQFAYMAKELQPLSITPILARLADAYRSEKLKQGFVDYSDQVALAERAVREVPAIRERERELHTQVLLDEYQDTSHLQTRLLQNLFAASSVFAVGDPNQSIYGWRGASASNLKTFYSDFAAPETSASFPLSTSWRNPQRVLNLANHLIDSLKVVELEASPNAQAGTVQIEFAEDLNLEAAGVADWFKQQMKGDDTGALLMRKRSQMQTFVTALEEAGLEVEVVGLGGLLEMPEIVDLVCALRVLHNPASGTQLIRLLAGPRWRIGAKDLERLHRYAGRKARVEEELREKIQEGLAPEDSLSIVDALDLILDEREPEKIGFSELGLARLRDAAQLFRAMRQQTGMGLVEFVRSVEQELWLDVEVRANPRRKNPMAHLNAFAAIVSGYAGSNSQPYLGGFLNWLEFADERERFEVPSTNPERGVVQVLTVHAAKGLEWDHVAVANLVDGDFPSTGRGSSGWLATGQLPFPLRGDAESLPVWNYKNHKAQPEVKKSIDDFKEEMRAHLLNEELRLMYVAVTRPKNSLLLTGSYWKPANKNPRKPSSFLIAAADKFDIPIPEQGSVTNPIEAVELTEVWPIDPLGEKHRKLLEKSALATLDAEQNLTEKIQGILDSDQIHSEIELLLAEKEKALLQLDQAVLPVRIPASSFKDYVSDFSEVTSRLKRPMPQPPYKQTRTGTLFHSWVESQFGAGARGGQLMDQKHSADASAFEDVNSSEDGIDTLKQNFLSSRFAKLTPIEIEREIQLTVAGNTFICKLDAVFETENGVEIVDWKTGKAPKDAADQELKTLQLALYRLAYSRFTGIPQENIEVCFYFVSENKEVRPQHVPSENELLDLWSKIAAL
jgi:DNA helicase-2/ATP-dependent DNA helicase PcrA